MALYIGNWGYKPYKWSYSPHLELEGAHFVRSHGVPSFDSLKPPLKPICIWVNFIAWCDKDMVKKIRPKMLFFSGDWRWNPLKSLSFSPKKYRAYYMSVFTFRASNDWIPTCFCGLFRLDIQLFIPGAQEVISSRNPVMLGYAWDEGSFPGFQIG